MCKTCGKDRGFKSKNNLVKNCRSCSSKIQLSDPKKNPMYGRKHKDKHRFRKNSYDHYDYSDSIVEYTKTGNKILKYRKSCPSCKIEMGYHKNTDAGRVCKTCRDKNITMYTKDHKRIRSSVKANISARLRSRNCNKNYTSTFSMLPYTFEQLLERLESQFKPGMTWENYGEWEIDHIKPDSWFQYDSYSDEDFIKSWSLDNLQPLWKSQNASKSNKYEG
jgi:hypothetical protein